jgi:hypothetical protein
MAGLTAAQVVHALSDAAARWCNADFPPRVRATRAVMERTGYTEPVVDFALDTLFGGLTRAALLQTIVGELGSQAALDGFVARPGRGDVHFRGVARATIVSSDTTIGVAIPPLAYALCANVGTIVIKDRSDGLVMAFAETIVEERPELGRRMRIEHWTGHDAPEALEALATSDVVVAFGGDGALSAIRARLRPEARFVPYGHRTSVAYVSRNLLAAAAFARGAAFDLACDALLYDGDGCLSLHAIFVERGGELNPRVFDALLGDALDAAAVEFPAAADEPAPGTARFARAARFRAGLGTGLVRGGQTQAHVLAADLPLDQPPPLFPRALATYPVDGPHDVTGFLRRHALPLEAFALDELCFDGTQRPELTTLALASGAVRLARFGRLQAPSLAAEHGGTPRILPFVRAVVRDAADP